MNFHFSQVEASLYTLPMLCAVFNALWKKFFSFMRNISNFKTMEQCWSVGQGLEAKWMGERNAKKQAKGKNNSSEWKVISSRDDKKGLIGVREQVERRWWKNTFNIQVDASSGSSFKLSWGSNGIHPIEMSIHNFKSFEFTIFESNNFQQFAEFSSKGEVNARKRGESDALN